MNRELEGLSATMETVRREDEEFSASVEKQRQKQLQMIQQMETEMRK